MFLGCRQFLRIGDKLGERIRSPYPSFIFEIQRKYTRRPADRTLPSEGRNDSSNLSECATISAVMAQLVEHCLGKAEVGGSSPLNSL